MRRKPSIRKLLSNESTASEVIVSDYSEDHAGGGEGGTVVNSLKKIQSKLGKERPRKNMYQTFIIEQTIVLIKMLYLPKRIY